MAVISSLTRPWVLALTTTAFAVAIGVCAALAFAGSLAALAVPRGHQQRSSDHVVPEQRPVTSNR